MRKNPEPAAAGVDQEGVATAGRLLRERRQLQGLTPEEVGLAICVAPRQIAAVEEGRLKDLPPQPYARGLIRAYALRVGLEPGDLLRVCGRGFSGEGEPRGGRIFRYPARERFIWREWLAPIVLAAITVTIVIARALLLPEPATLVPPPAGVPEAPGPPGQQAAAPAPAPADSPAADEAGQTGAAGAAAVTAAAVAAQEAAEAADAEAAAAVAQPGVRVLLRCEGTTWAEAAIDGGEPRRHELGPGQSLELAARERIVLALGDAGMIRLRVNERELGFIGYKGETKTGLSFTAPKAAAGAPPAVAGD